MNVTNKVLRLLGMKLASELITGQVDPEVKLWRAVIVLAIEDVLNTSESLMFRPERKYKKLLRNCAQAYLKAENEQFKNIWKHHGKSILRLRKIYAPVSQNLFN